MQTGEEYEDMNILDERAVYREETARWYKSGEEFKTPGVVATSYPEAFETLYGHSMPMPANVRAQHKESVFA